VAVVFEVDDTAELANLLAQHHEPARRPRPLRGAPPPPHGGPPGALLGAAAGAALWFLAQRTLRNEILVAALAVGLLAGVGALLLGGRCRANQLLAAGAAVVAVVVMRLVWVHLTVADERLRALRLADPTTELGRLLLARLDQRLTVGALARGLADGLGLAAYAVVAAVAWRLPRR
jgi:hypothetical protein